MRLTKIIATLGPATASEDVLRGAIIAGMDVARLNFSHGTYEDHLAVLERVRRISAEEKRNVAILQDLCGPKIRLGKVRGGRVELEEGAEVRIVREDVECDAHTLSTTYPAMVNDVNVGKSVLINDGLIELRVVGKETGALDCKVVAGGPVSSHKGINLPGVKISSPTLTAKDREDLEWGIERNVDYVALSFVRHPDDVRELKEIIKSRGSDIAVISKIEKPEALEHIEEIAKESDAVMVARGDLGVEMRVEEVPHIQKTIIGLCESLNRPVIVATQMLESMIQNSTPTRAEVSDVANAIIDGADALMLSGETSVGKYPLRAITTMAHVARRTEQTMKTTAALDRRLHLAASEEFGNVISASVAQLAHRLPLRLVVGFTASGRTVRLLSGRRRPIPILGASNSARVLRKMCLYRGVKPVAIEMFEQSEEMFRRGQDLAVENNLAGEGDTIIFVAGIPLGTGATNTMRLHKIKIE